MHEWMGKLRSPEISVRNQPTLCNIPEDRIYMNDEITITHARAHTHTHTHIYSYMYENQSCAIREEHRLTVF